MAGDLNARRLGDPGVMEYRPPYISPEGHFAGDADMKADSTARVFLRSSSTSSPTGSKMDNPNGIYHSIVRPGCRLQLTRDACRGYQPTKSSLFDTVPAGEDAMSLLKQRPYTGRSAGHGISTSKSPSPSRQRQLRAFSLIRT